MIIRVLSVLTICALFVPLPADSRQLQQVVKIAPYGNSITQAAGDHDSYRYPLWKKLIDAGISFDFVGSMTTNFNNVTRSYADYKGKQFDRDHEGHWGWRADEILNKANDNINNWLTRYSPEMVLLHIGSNDCIQGQDNNTTQTEITQIIQKLRGKNENVVIFLATLIPCNASSSASSLVSDLNNRIKTLVTQQTTETSPVILVDQFAGFISGGDQYDGIHPNPAGEEKMAQKWFDAINGYLTSTHTRKQPAPAVAPHQTAHQTASSYRLSIPGLQRNQEQSASLSATGVFTNLLGKQLFSGKTAAKTGNGVYVFPVPAEVTR
ncbi:MAG: hypothetical protein JW863_15850 [Chitinispirillaceae bacterium]|nr:hypothetical protein [Chitinispirillaceae bacterium]